MNNDPIDISMIRAYNVKNKIRKIEQFIFIIYVELIY